MKKRFLYAFCFLVSIITSQQARCQKIEYEFGKESDVLDSVKSAINLYKKWYNKSENKLDLFVIADYCSDKLNLILCQYPSKKPNGFMELIKASNRIIRINAGFYLPVIFQPDIVSQQINKEKIAYFSFGGIQIGVQKNDRSVWRVTEMHEVF